MTPTKPIQTTASSQGMAIIDDQGKTCVDLVAALSSCLGHRHPNVVEAIKQVCDQNLGTAFDCLASDWHVELAEGWSRYERCQLVSSATAANEVAFRIARSAFGPERYRVITLLGSDHGDSFAMRSAGGRIHSQGVDGPVAAGYRHIMPGNIGALTKAIDSLTAAVCIAPVDWNKGGEAFDLDYLKAVASLCQERELLLIIDETRLPPGVSGALFFHDRAEINADIVTASSGWFGGASGGMTLLNSTTLAVLNRSEGPNLDWLNHHPDSPLLRAAITATARTITNERLLSGVAETVDLWAAMLDEVTRGFDFVRSCIHAGLWTTIELDLPAVDAAARSLANGLRLFVAGETTLLICPPITATGDSLLEAIEPLRRTFESLERETITS